INMSKKPEPSFELKKIIWDIAATVGKNNPTDIQRQLDILWNSCEDIGNNVRDAIRSHSFLMHTCKYCPGNLSE
ncbi:hypothetical protein ACFLY3_05025, partial [Chloroflexota bacterium]